MEINNEINKERSDEVVWLKSLCWGMGLALIAVSFLGLMNL
jgi:hypothetical protein